VALGPPERTIGKEKGVVSEGRVVLSTIHSAKGQEWRSVTILNVIDGCLPFRKAMRTAGSIEEERRLLYVAMTRAKDALELTAPKFHFSYLNSAEDQRSERCRFIPKEPTGTFDCRDLTV
jgi:DNA helicase-2/ATP-dependent DNA helicase PcrA